MILFVGNVCSVSSDAHGGDRKVEGFVDGSGCTKAAMVGDLLTEMGFGDSG